MSVQLQDADAQRQIRQMCNFIINEAREKASEIEARALEDFNIEKLKLLQQQKNKVLREYEAKAKALETERAIARSTAINKARLKKIAARATVVDEVASAAKTQLASVSQEDSDGYHKLIVKLILQALLMLLEPDVVIRCREEDEGVVKGCLNDAARKFNEIIKDQCGVERKVNLKIDTQNYLPTGPRRGYEGVTCSGGVIVSSKDGKISVDNTLDARLQYAISDCLPQVRKTLFPVH